MMLGASAGFWHGDLGARSRSAFTYFTIIYLDRASAGCSASDRAS